MVSPFWYPTELSYMKALGKVIAVNPWKVWEECTARRKQATGNLIQQTYSARSATLEDTS